MASGRSRPRAFSRKPRPFAGGATALADGGRTVGIFR